MILSADRWLQFKRELYSMIFISIIHIWWCFNFPPINRAGAPLNIIISISSSVIGVLMYAYMFTYPEKCFPKWDNSYLENTPSGKQLKIFRLIFVILSGNVGAFIIWYKDVYRMPTIFYGFSYIYCCITFALLWKANKRNIAAANQNS
jgi:hypothetical protein